MNKKTAIFAYTEFEKLIAELLVALNFENVSMVRGKRGRDAGYDIQAVYSALTPTGDKTPQRWFIQVNHSHPTEKLIDNLAILLSILQVKNGDRALFVTSNNLTSAAYQYTRKFSSSFDGKLELWDRNTLSSLLVRFPHLQTKYKLLIEDFPVSLSAVQSPKYERLIKQLSECPVGKTGWQDFERICITIMEEVFVPPLKHPKPQSRTLNGLERRDVLFSLRGVNDGWEIIRQEFEAKFLLCEFKNYTEAFSKDEVNQTRNYLRNTIGKLGIIFSRRGPDENALKMRNSVYSQDKKVILFFEDKHLIELLQLKASGQNPLDLLQDAIDDFYISHE